MYIVYNTHNTIDIDGHLAVIHPPMDVYHSKNKLQFNMSLLLLRFIVFICFKDNTKN